MRDLTTPIRRAKPQSGMGDLRQFQSSLVRNLHYNASIKIPA
jgi:hypothetical protein